MGRTGAQLVSLVEGVGRHTPIPTAFFRRRAWLAFQRALDPLAPPRPLRPPRRR